MEEAKVPKTSRKRRIPVITWKPQRTVRLIGGSLVPVDVFRSRGLLRIRKVDRRIRGPKSHCMSCSILKVTANGFSFNNGSRDKFICWTCLGKLFDKLESDGAVQTVPPVKITEEDKDGAKNKSP
jgi:hypothetical protein